jgi:ribosomal protein L16 Arg81 hydroxylase
MKTMRLDTLLNPVTSEEFFSKYIFTEPLFVKGSVDKFASLFTWDSLNRILSYNRHDPMRVHVNKVGATAEELQFTHQVQNVRGEDILRIDVPALYRLLRAGATLVVDAVNEVDPVIATLSEELGALFLTSRTTTVLFASFGHTPGFAVHWDSRDVYALQVEGEKHWSVYEPSRVAPLGRGDASIPGCGEPGPLCWEGTMQRGDLLYIPRGWWHEVTSTDSPSLHLNFGFAPLTGVDFMAWLNEELCAEDFMRKDMPRFASPETFEEYSRSLASMIVMRLQASCITDFLAAQRTTALPQTHVSLPLGVGPKYASLNPTHSVRLVTPLVNVVGDDSSLVLRGGGRETAIPIWARPLTDRLCSGTSASIAELAGTVDDIPFDDVCSLVVLLIERGFVCTDL